MAAQGDCEEEPFIPALRRGDAFFIAEGGDATAMAAGGEVEGARCTADVEAALLQWRPPPGAQEVVYNAHPGASRVIRYRDRRGNLQYTRTTQARRDARATRRAGTAEFMLGFTGTRDAVVAGLNASRPGDTAYAANCALLVLFSRFMWCTSKDTDPNENMLRLRVRDVEVRRDRGVVALPHAGRRVEIVCAALAAALGGLLDAGLRPPDFVFARRVGARWVHIDSGDVKAALRAATNGRHASHSVFRYVHGDVAFLQVLLEQWFSAENDEGRFGGGGGTTAGFIEDVLRAARRAATSASLCASEQTYKQTYMCTAFGNRFRADPAAFVDVAVARLGEGIASTVQWAGALRSESARELDGGGEV